MPLRPALLALAAWLALEPGAAGARAPFLTGDPEPIDPGRWEASLASRTSFDGAGLTGSLPEVELDWGFAPGLQLHAVLPLALSTAGGQRRFGTGDAAVGAKLRLADKQVGDVRGQIGLFPTLTLPSAGAGLGEGRAVAFLPVWAQTTYGPWAAYGGGGIRTATEGLPSGSFFFGWVLQRQLGPALLGAEVVYQADGQRQRPSRSGGSLGGTLDLSPRHRLLASLGFGTAQHDLRAYLGWLVVLATGAEDGAQ
jgi:hypothetical protein